MAEEKISCNIPLYTYRGHLAPFTINHTTIRFTPDNPLPAVLVRKIVEVRVAENAGK